MYRIVPKDGLLIPAPTGGDLPAGGVVVPVVDLYWRRREADGDVVITALPDAAPAGEVAPVAEVAETAPAGEVAPAAEVATLPDAAPAAEATDPAVKAPKRSKE